MLHYLVAAGQLPLLIDVVEWKVSGTALGVPLNNREIPA
jgi:hypothetical protein